MSTGPPTQAEGQGPGGPVPPQRAHVLGRLQAERRAALGCYEYGRVAEIDAQIRRLSAGSAAIPSRETTGRPAARKQRTR